MKSRRISYEQRAVRGVISQPINTQIRLIHGLLELEKNKAPEEIVQKVEGWIAQIQNEYAPEQHKVQTLALLLFVLNHISFDEIDSAILRGESLFGITTQWLFDKLRGADTKTEKTHLLLLGFSKMLFTITDKFNPGSVQCIQAFIQGPFASYFSHEHRCQILTVMQHFASKPVASLLENPDYQLSTSMKRSFIFMLLLNPTSKEMPENQARAAIYRYAIHHNSYTVLKRFFEIFRNETFFEKTSIPQMIVSILQFVASNSNKIEGIESLKDCDYPESLAPFLLDKQFKSLLIETNTPIKLVREVCLKIRELYRGKKINFDTDPLLIFRLEDNTLHTLTPNNFRAFWDIRDIEAELVTMIERGEKINSEILYYQDFSKKILSIISRFVKDSDIREKICNEINSHSHLEFFTPYQYACKLQEIIYSRANRIISLSLLENTIRDTFKLPRIIDLGEFIVKYDYASHSLAFYKREGENESPLPPEDVSKFLKFNILIPSTDHDSPCPPVWQSFESSFKRLCR